MLTSATFGNCQKLTSQHSRRTFSILALKNTTKKLLSNGRGFSRP